MAATLAACRAVFHPPPGRLGVGGKASQRTPSAQARWEASRARTAGGRLAGKRRRPQAAASGPSRGCLFNKATHARSCGLSCKCFFVGPFGLRVLLSATSVSNTFNLLLGPM